MHACIHKFITDIKLYKCIHAWHSYRYITLQCIHTLNCIRTTHTIHHIALHHITSHIYTPHHTTPHHTTAHHITSHHNTTHHITYINAPHCMTLPYIHNIAIPYTTHLHTSRYVAIRYIQPLYTYMQPYNHNNI